MLQPRGLERRDSGMGFVAVVGVVAAVLYSSYVLEVFLPSRHHWLVVVSDLEIPGGWVSALLRIADVVSGLAMLVLLRYVWAALPVGRWRIVAVSMTALFACTNAAAALVTLPCPHARECASTADQVQRWLHVGISAASTVALALGAMAIALSVRRQHVPWLRRASWFTFWVTCVAGSALLVVCDRRDSASWGTGLSQRVQITLTSLWILCLTHVATHGGQARGRPR